MASSSKTQQIGQICSLLKKRYKAEASDAHLSVLEAVVLGICRDGTTAEQANQVLSRIKDHFFDWNEVRVSTIQEIEGVLAGLTRTEERANSIRLFLRQLFTKTYGFSLEALTKKPFKESLKTLQEYEAFKSDYVVATVIHRALGGHAIPVDSSVKRALARLGVAEAQTEPATLRATLEHVVPKTQGSQFLEWMESLCHDTCREHDPDCPNCDLRKICPSGQERLAAKKAGVKPPKTAPAPAPAKAPMAAAKKPTDKKAAPTHAPTHAPTPAPKPTVKPAHKTEKPKSAPPKATPPKAAPLKAAPPKAAPPKAAPPKAAPPKKSTPAPAPSPKAKKTRPK